MLELPRNPDLVALAARAPDAFDTNVHGAGPVDVALREALAGVAVIVHERESSLARGTAGLVSARERCRTAIGKHVDLEDVVFIENELDLRTPGTSLSRARVDREVGLEPLDLTDSAQVSLRRGVGVTRCAKRPRGNRGIARIRRRVDAERSALELPGRAILTGAAGASLVVVALDVAASAVIAVIRDITTGVVALDEAGSARNAALALHANSTAGADVPASAAVGGIREQILLATVREVAVAVAETGCATFEDALLVLTGLGRIRVIALLVAITAMPKIRIDIRLAAVRRVAVTVLVTRRAVDELTRAVHASANPVRERALVSAHSAVEAIGADIRLAAIAGVAAAIPVAVGPSGIACTELADTGLAALRCVREIA